jgi:hypothetical protein
MGLDLLQAAILQSTPGLNTLFVRYGSRPGEKLGQLAEDVSQYLIRQVWV